MQKFSTFCILRSEQENRKTLENIEKINIFKGFVFGGDGEI